MYEQYCKQRLMLHQPFRQPDEFLGTCDLHILFSSSGAVPPSLAEDIHQLEAVGREKHEDDNEVNFSTITCIYYLREKN